MVTYELREDFAALARANVEAFLGKAENLEIKIGNVYEPVEETDIDRIVLELTEQTCISRDSEARLLENLSALSARGMVISQDDFGSGYASLQVLGLQELRSPPAAIIDVIVIYSNI